MGYFRYCEKCGEGLHSLELEDLPTWGGKATCHVCGSEREDDTLENRIDLLIIEFLELREKLEKNVDSC